MKTEFRTRVFLPVVLPLAILLAVAAFIGVFALTLLNGTHSMSLALAAVAAGGILFTISLAAAQDRLDPLRRGVLGVAVLTPFIVGGAFASGLVGSIGDEQRMINVAPPLEAPDDAVLAAENAQEFCLPTGDGGCEATDEWTASEQTAEEWVYRFENRDPGVQHNLSIRELEGSADAPEPGAEINRGELITGEAEVTEVAEPGLEPGQYYFVCDVHQPMTGVLEVTEGDGEDGDAAA